MAPAVEANRPSNPHGIDVWIRVPRSITAQVGRAVAIGLWIFLIRWPMAWYSARFEATVSSYGLYYGTESRKSEDIFGSFNLRDYR